MLSSSSNQFDGCKLRSGRIIGPAENILTEQINDSFAITFNDSTATTFFTESQFISREREFACNMADGISSLLPNPFYGKEDENVEDFLRTIDLWVTLRKADEDTSRSALSLLLRGAASTWFHTQPRRVTESFRALKDALVERYGPQQELAWKSTASLWQLQQSKGQSTEDFVATVVKEGRKIGIDDNQLHCIALNGMRPELRQHVIQHSVRNLDELRRWGKLTELSLQDVADEDSAASNMARELAELKNEVRQLRIHAIKPLHQSCSSSPGPNMLPSGREGQQMSVDSSFTEPISSYQEQRINEDVPPIRQQSFYQQSNRVQSQRRPSQQMSMSSQQMSMSSQQRIIRCNNCGGRHLRNVQCPARNKPCFSCGKIGHYQSVCRSARGPRTMHRI